MEKKCKRCGSEDIKLTQFVLTGLCKECHVRKEVIDDVLKLIDELGVRNRGYNAESFLMYDSDWYNFKKEVEKLKG